MSISELLVLYYCVGSTTELELLHTHHNYCLKIILVVWTIFTHLLLLIPMAYYTDLYCFCI